MARSLQRALADEGKHAPLWEIRAQMAVTLGHALDHYRARLGLTEETVARYHAYCRQEGPQAAAPFPHVKEICARVCAQGGHNHLCTHRGASAKALLDAHGLNPYFSRIVTAADGFARKPAPDSVLHIVRTSGADKRLFWMIGDRELDVKAAHNAGVRACLYTNGERGIATEAERVLPDFADFFALFGEEALGEG